MTTRELLDGITDEDISRQACWWREQTTELDARQHLARAVVLLMNETGRSRQLALGWLQSRCHGADMPAWRLHDLAEQEALRARGLRVSAIADTLAVAWISEHDGAKLKGCICGWVLDWFGRERLLVFRPEYSCAEAAAKLRGRDVLLEYSDPDGTGWQLVAHMMPPLKQDGGADGELLCLAMPDGRESAMRRWERGEPL